VIVIPGYPEPGKEGCACGCWGAELIEVPGRAYKNPNNYVRLSGRLAEQLARNEPMARSGPNQFDNVANRQAISKAPVPEIWEQTAARWTASPCAVGTGGTFGGCRDRA
jgi:cysteine synthase A